MKIRSIFLTGLAIVAFYFSSYAANDYDWLVIGSDTPVYSVSSIKYLSGRCIFTLKDFTGTLEFNPTTTDGKILLSILLVAKSTGALVTACKNGPVTTNFWYINQINIK